MWPLIPKECLFSFPFASAHEATYILSVLSHHWTRLVVTLLGDD